MKILILFCLLFANSAHGIEIEDQGGVFERLAAESQGNTFDDVMKCGQRHTIGATDASCSVQCSTAFCRSMCSQAVPPNFDIAVEDCSDGLAHIYGENGISIPVSKADFAKGGNTLAWVFLQDIGRYLKPVGKVILDSAWWRPVTMIVNGDKTSVDAVEIWGTISYGENVQSLNFTLTVIPQQRDARQIAFFGPDPMNYFYRVKGVVNEEGF